MMGQIFQGDFIILNYYTHQQKYEALCINKDKPQMHCNGRCQMDKQLVKAHRQEANNPESTHDVKVVIVLYCEVDSLHFNWINTKHKLAIPLQRESAIIHRDLSSPFRPPKYSASC